jgi:phospholipase/carboxylesterase
MSQIMKKYYNTVQNPKRLMFFLHGYNGCAEDIEQAVRPFATLDDLLIVTPQAGQVSEKNTQKRQWYSLRAFDPADRRRCPDTPTDELMSIYDRYGDVLLETASALNCLIDEVQDQTGVDNAHTVIAGFSQGAMLACFTALTRFGFDGRCFMFSGVTAGASVLESHQKSKPRTYLFHGQDDTVVNFKTSARSQQWLEAHGVPVTARTYEHLAHRIVEDETDDALRCL